MIPVKPQLCKWCCPTTNDDKPQLTWSGQAVVSVVCPVCGLTGPGVTPYEFRLNASGSNQPKPGERMQSQAIRQWNRLHDLIEAGRLVME